MIANPTHYIGWFILWGWLIGWMLSIYPIYVMLMQSTVREKAAENKKIEAKNAKKRQQIEAKAERLQIPTTLVSDDEKYIPLEEVSDGDVAVSYLGAWFFGMLWFVVAPIYISMIIMGHRKPTLMGEANRFQAALTNQRELEDRIKVLEEEMAKDGFDVTS
jgi:hypothetical protein